MIKNKYFIIDVGKINRKMLKKFVAKDIKNIRMNNKKTKGIIKLPIGTRIIPSIIKSIKIYNHNKIKKELTKAEWLSKKII